MTAPPDPARRRLTLIVCCSALFMTTLDNTILNVALPSLQEGLKSSAAGLQWAVDGYILVRASTLFISGSLSDRFGRRRVFDIGLVIFILASLCCSLAPTLELLIAARAVQGAGSAL
ncbi:MAG TPA: MFS transporter, partial [Mycobacteriales bacterium]|nr:MFS transporter [Mycobacteriales bacterium]